MNEKQQIRADLIRIAQWFQDLNSPDFPNFRCADELRQMARYLEDNSTKE